MIYSCLFSCYSWFSPTWLLPWRRLLSAMLVPKQTRSIERSQWERKLKSVLCVVLCCGSRSDWDKLIGLSRIPSVVFATRRIWGRTDYRAERKIKNKNDSRGDTESNDVFDSERERLACTNKECYQYDQTKNIISSLSLRKRLPKKVDNTDMANTK